MPDRFWRIEDHRADPGPVATPPRRAGSVRRTTSMEMAYPEGLHGPVALVGRGRDVVTPVADAEPVVLAEDRLVARVSVDGRLEQFDSVPACPEAAQWLGHSTMGGFRQRIQPLRQDPARAHRPIVQLLDDLVGCGVIASWVSTRWAEDTQALAARAVHDQRRMLGACIAYAPGSSAFAEDRYLRTLALVAPLQRADDPHAFHPLQPDTDRTQRRVRRVDVWREASGDVRVDAMFQDSGVAPGTRRVAIHEYRVRAVARGAPLLLQQLSAEHGQLPHGVCRSAPAGLQSLLGLPLAALLGEVPVRFRGTAGCTHLNDAVRALAAVPALVRQLP
jgi:hypothetical protein